MKFEVDLDIDQPGQCYICPMCINDSWGRDRCAITYRVVKAENLGTHGSVWVKPEDCPLKVIEKI